MIPYAINKIDDFWDGYIFLPFVLKRAEVQILHAGVMGSIPYTR